MYGNPDAVVGNLPQDDPDYVATTKKVIGSAQYLADHLAEVPVHVIPCIEGRTDNLPVAWQAAIWGSLLPAVWSFMLAARARGPRHLLDHAAPHRGEGGRRAAGHPRPRDAGRAHPRRPHARRHRLQARCPPRPRPHHPHRRVVMDAELRRQAEAARGFMPADEGMALHDAAVGGRGRRPDAGGGHVLRQVVGLPGCGRAVARPGAVHRRPPPRLGGEPAGLGVARARPRRSGRRQDGHAAVLPQDDPRRRARGHRDRRRGRLADGGLRLGHAPGLPLHRRRPRRGAGSRRLRALDAARASPAARSASTTSSPTRPTAAARRTSRSTSLRWPAGGSRRSRPSGASASSAASPEAQPSSLARQ